MTGCEHGIKNIDQRFVQYVTTFSVILEQKIYRNIHNNANALAADKMLYRLIKRLFQVPNLQLKLPGKKLFGNNLDPQFVAQRREGLNAFVQQLMQDPKLLNMLVFYAVSSLT